MSIDEMERENDRRHGASYFVDGNAVSALTQAINALSDACNKHEANTEQKLERVMWRHVEFCRALSDLHALSGDAVRSYLTAFHNLVSACDGDPKTAGQIVIDLYNYWWWEPGMGEPAK